MHGEAGMSNVKLKAYPGILSGLWTCSLTSSTMVRFCWHTSELHTARVKEAVILTDILLILVAFTLSSLSFLSTLFDLLLLSFVELLAAASFFLFESLDYIWSARWVWHVQVTYLHIGLSPLDDGHDLVGMAVVELLRALLRR
jgi:hypothetical protein